MQTSAHLHIRTSALGEGAAPAITQLLCSKGRHTIGHETNLSRSPLWSTRQRRAPEDTVISPTLYGHAFRQVEGSSLTTADQRLFAHLTTGFVRNGCPADRRVPFSLGDAALALDYEERGGKQRSLVRGSLARLRSVTIESAIRHTDGHETVLGWGLIDSYLVTTKGNGKGWIVLSEAVSLLLKEGSVTFLHEPTWKTICSEDEVAGRLWSFLEAENVRNGWKYAIFPSAIGGPSSIPAISDVLMLHWASRRKVAQRIKEACAVIANYDRRYQLDVMQAKTVSGWNLVCSSSQLRLPRSPQSGIPDSVIRAWRHVYRSQLPNTRQRAVLGELMIRHSAEWITDILNKAFEQGQEPFRHLLEQDKFVSNGRINVAREAEYEWEMEKHRQSTGAERSLTELILEVKGRATSA